MANLTVAEKTHWRDRIEAKIDRHVEGILAADPGLIDRVKREARSRAFESLGLAEFQAELEQIAAQKGALDRRERRARRAMLARVRGVDVETVEERYYGSLDPEVNTAITKRKVVHEDELLGENELGRQVLRLRTEKDRLLDTVWLACSPTQIKQLWSSVTRLLSDEPTELERQAISIPPSGEEGG
jgi:hypothetical protein